jgi:PHP family Zn ribbon phosphoesterase
MHFRVRKNVIQLIRTKYDDGKKKGVNTIIGTVKLAKPELSADLRQNLTAEEIAAFEIWVKTHHHTDMLREEIAALTLTESINLAEKWFEREGNSAAAQTAARDIIFHWQSMRKLFVKSGLLE